MGILRTIIGWGSGVQFTLRAVTALLMILSLFLAQFGYPVWKVVAKKVDRPFPCQFSSCGCQTADQCRVSCCCHSKRERVAWAVERGIDADRVAVLTPEEKAEFTSAAKFELKEAKSCCQVAASTVVKKASCCSQPQQASCCHSSASSKVEKSKFKVHWVLAISANKCRGTGVEWIQAGMVAPPPLPITFELEPLTALSISEAQPIYFSLATEPLLRPV